jgi:hypothetical protein
MSRASGVANEHINSAMNDTFACKVSAPLARIRKIRPTSDKKQGNGKEKDKDYINVKTAGVTMGCAQSACRV